MRFIMAASISPWSQLLALYGEMTVNAPNPSGLAGNNIDPLDDIIEQLKSGDPNSNKITADLDNLENELTEMVSIAVANQLAPASAPNFIDVLKSAAASIATLKTEVGTPEFANDFQSFLLILGNIKQDILQG